MGQREHARPRAGARLPQHGARRPRAPATAHADGPGRDGQHLLRNADGGRRPRRQHRRATPRQARYRPRRLVPGRRRHRQPLPVRTRRVRTPHPGRSRRRGAVRADDRSPGRDLRRRHQQPPPLHVGGQAPLLLDVVLQLAVHLRPALRHRPVRVVRGGPGPVPRRLRRTALYDRAGQRRGTRRAVRDRPAFGRLLVVEPRRHPVPNRRVRRPRRHAVSTRRPGAPAGTTTLRRRYLAAVTAAAAARGARAALADIGGHLAPGREDLPLVSRRPDPELAPPAELAGPELLGAAYEATLGAAERRRRGAFYTPAPLAAELASVALAGRGPGARVWDPAVGGGALLLAAARALIAAGGDPATVVASGLGGVDNDALAVDVAVTALGILGGVTPGAVTVGDGLAPPAAGRWDVVIANPPFRGQLKLGTVRNRQEA